MKKYKSKYSNLTDEEKKEIVKNRKKQWYQKNKYKISDKSNEWISLNEGNDVELLFVGKATPEELAKIFKYKL